MSYDISIVGAGILGLATAFELKLQKPQLKICIIDKESDVASHQTGHNSGVIHSGIYYKPGSLKARNCVRGYRMMLDYLEMNDIPFEVCGKVIVATSESELPALNTIFERGQQNGLSDLRILSGSETKDIEPHVNAVQSLWVPQTGIVNFKDVAQSLKKNLTKLEVDFKLSEKVLKINFDRRVATGNSIQIETTQGDFSTKHIVNCAGLHCDSFIQEEKNKKLFRIFPFRGEYYELAKEKESLVKNLIYPVPDPRFPFLGVHFTRMMKGGVEAGPNAVLALAREGYSWGDIRPKDILKTLSWPGFLPLVRKYWDVGIGEVHRSLFKSAFTKALQKLVPEVQEADLVKGGSGVRAQAMGPDGKLIDDFLIINEPQVTHVGNAPSPAATSSLSIGKTLADSILESTAHSL